MCQDKSRKNRQLTELTVNTVVLSVGDGALGVLLGILIPNFVSQYFPEIQTVITLWSLELAFGVSVFVGVILGLYPAVRAANLDPIQALRHE